MKKLINKAIDNGFGSFNIQNCTIWWWHDDGYLYVDETYEYPIGSGRKGRVHYHHLTQLLFGTDFVEKLVGEGSYCFIGSCAWQNADRINKPECKFCSHSKYNPADHHRCEMANMKDIGKMVEYLRSIVNDQT